MSGFSIRFFEALVEQVSFFIAVKDASTRRYVFVNEAFCTLIERPRAEIIGKRDEELFPEEWAVEEREREDQVALGGERFGRVEVVFAAPSGRRVAALEIVLLSDGFEGGEGEGGARLMISGRDLTEVKRQEEGATMEKELFRQVIDTDPNLIFVKDRYGNFVLVNKAVSDAFGMPVEALVNQSNRKVHEHDDEVDAYTRVDREVMKTMRELVVEEPFTHASGKTLWYRTLKKPLLRAWGEVQVLAISMDITHLKEAQEERERALVELERKAEEARQEAAAKAALAEELDRRLSIIEQQNREILSLSVPMLDVGGAVLGVPIIGTLTAARAAEVMETLLRSIVERRSRHVIVDLTGLE